MPMPQFVGYSQSVLDAQKQRANIDNTLTNMAIRQQMAPLEMQLKQQAVAQGEAEAPYAADIAKAKVYGSPFQHEQLKRLTDLDSQKADLERQKQYYSEQFALLRDAAAQRRDDVMLKGIEAREREADRRFQLMMGRIDAAAGKQQAPTMTEVVDPAKPDRMLRVDAKTYKGGTLGSDGVLGISGKEPTAAKKEESRVVGQEGLDTIASALRGYYDQLDKSGGIANPANGALGNIAANVRSSNLGQWVGKQIGTEDQSARNAIAQQRPLLLQAIKQATGMSAKQMDSNAEMKMYLQAATDPQLDVQANRAALDMLEKLYGMKTPGQGAPAAPNTPRQATGKVRFLGFE